MTSKLVNNRFKRIAYSIIGWLSLALGVLGIFLPLLPTTPFLLLTAACFARSSDKFHHWLIEHKVFGTIIKHWRSDKKIPVRAKIIISLMVLATLMLSLFSLGWIK